MKTKLISIVSTLAFIVFCTHNAFCTTSEAMVEKSAHKEPEVALTDLGQLLKAKVLTQVQKSKNFFAKNGIGFKDPVNKWLWFWILGWILGPIIYMASAFIVYSSLTLLTWGGIAGLLVILFGSLSLRVWIIKKLLKKS